MDCVFCGIAAGEVPCMKVYEDEHTLVFMDVAGDVDGHMLAIPKEHVGSILDCDDDRLSHLMSAVKKVSNHCVDRCGFEGVNLLNASGASAGQSVPHFHIHLIPRRKDDGIDAWPPLEGAKKSIAEMWEKISM